VRAQKLPLKKAQSAPFPDTGISRVLTVSLTGTRFSWEAVSMADEKTPDAAGTATSPQSAEGTVRMVKCVKLGRELPGLDRIPWKGEIGKRVYDNVSKEAWKLWVEHSKMLMNEFRLNPLDPNSLKIMGDQMEQYFFGIGSNLPENFVPPPKH